MRSKQASCEIFILAGGLSARMGRDKSQMRLGSRSMLGHVRAVARGTGWPVRVVRRDAVERCGPLGGIYTALKRSRAEVVLFLACDMPFVSVELLEWMVRDFACEKVLSANQNLKPPPHPRWGRGGQMRVSQSPTRDQFEASLIGSKISAGLFASEGGKAGFPFLLRRVGALDVILEQMRIGEFSLQALAKKLKAKLWRLPRVFAGQLVNVNTPEELEKARRLL